MNNPSSQDPPATAAASAGAVLDGLTQARAAWPARQRPFVTLAYAQSVDGSIARRRGERFSLSGPDSLRLTHLLRGRHDAILVGVGTVLADDPELSVRLAAGADPRPIVVDSRLRTPPLARLVSRAATAEVCIATTTAAATATGSDGTPVGAALAARGARLLAGPALANGWVDLPALLRRLKGDGIEHLMVEGGAQIIASFLQARLVDYAVVTVAPLFLGGLPALGAVAGVAAPAAPDVALSGPTALPRLRGWLSHRVGDDLVIAGEVHWPAR